MIVVISEGIGNVGDDPVIEKGLEVVRLRVEGGTIKYCHEDKGTSNLLECIWTFRIYILYYSPEYICKISKHWSIELLCITYSDWIQLHYKFK